MYMPGLSDVLALQPITLAQWANLLLIASSLLLVEELHKWWIRKRTAPSDVDERLLIRSTD
jgi:hypothetical protein